MCEGKEERMKSVVSSVMELRIDLLQQKKHEKRGFNLSRGALSGKSG